MDKLGLFITCFNERGAVPRLIYQARTIYPEINGCIFSEGTDFQFLEKRFSGINSFLCKDTLTKALKATSSNFKEKPYCDDILVCAQATLDRLRLACNILNCEYIIMMDPDALIRGPLNIPEGSKILGSKINRHLPLDGVNAILKTIPGATPIYSWGATPGILHVDTLKKGLTLFEKDDTLLERFSKEVYAIYAHDLLLPILFATQGHEEQFNPDICECKRDPSWIGNGKPLLHQFKP